MPATAISDWPTPTVSTSTTSWPAASHSRSASRAPRDAAERAAGRRRADERLGAAREPLHTGLVAEDRAAAAAARRIDGQHREPVAVVDEVEAERLDERRLPRARRAADADAYRAARRGQQLVEERDRFFTMVGARRLDERDRTSERRPVAGLDRVGELTHAESWRDWSRSTISAAATGMFVPGP